MPLAPGPTSPIYNQWPGTIDGAYTLKNISPKENQIRK
uniref:Uncharacterized protein n=1 Tax=Rhizophora mucronata TaxID=61149 RepID=A0A2P2NRA7_RHIMU